jgi:hypothetical protein
VLDPPLHPAGGWRGEPGAVGVGDPVTGSVVVRQRNGECQVRPDWERASVADPQDAPL